MTTTTHDRDRALSAADLNVSLLAQDQYFRSLAWTAPMTDEEQVYRLRCLAFAQQEPENTALVQLAQDARDRLVECYQPLVVSMAKKFLPIVESMELLDLIQEGNIGLLRAIDEYHHSGFRHFRMFVGRHVRFALVMALRTTDGFIRLPDEFHTLRGRQRKVVPTLSLRLGRVPSLAEIADELGVTVDEIEQAYWLERSRHVESIQAIVDAFDMTEDRKDFVNVFQAFAVSASEGEASFAPVVRRVVQELPPRQRAVISLLYGFDEGVGSGCTQAVVAAELGMSQGAVAVHDREGKKNVHQALECVSSNGRVSYQYKPKRDARYYTVKETSRVLNIPCTTLRRYLAAGTLPLLPAYENDILVLPKEQVDTLAVARCSSSSPSVVA